MVMPIPPDIQAILDEPKVPEVIVTGHNDITYMWITLVGFVLIYVISFAIFWRRRNNPNRW